MNLSPLLSLFLILHCLRDVFARQCWQGPTYSETVLSPDLRSSSILRVPKVLTLTQCATACCDLPGCDLAWFFERRCYILSCQHKENCHPKKRSGTDSLLAFLQRRRPQALVLQSLVRGEPYWRPLARHKGPENPLKDLAFLQGIQDLDDNAMEYDEQIKEQEERPRLFDWPFLERDELNISDSEEGQTPSPSVTDGNRTSPSSAEPSWRPPAFSIPTVKDEDDQFNITFDTLDPTSVPQVDSSDPSKPSQVSSSLPSQSNMETTTQNTSSQSAQALVVSVQNPGDLTLPVGTAEFTASVSSDSEPDIHYTYEWSFVRASDGQQGVMKGKHSRTVQVSGLTAGEYTLRVSVWGKLAHGEEVVNFTVHPEVSLNLPPKSVAVPELQDVSSSDGVIFINGSQSTDDTGKLKYLWEQVDGPPWKSEDRMDAPVLTLQNLSPGEYTFRLTVTDSENLTDSSTATVRVSSIKDEPPVASAGVDQVIRLPQNHLTLWANQSTDDHRIISYLWSLRSSSANKAPVIQGERFPALQLSDLQVGLYSIQLTVTDSSGQQDSDSVLITVLSENRAPVAVVGPDREMLPPESSVILNGSSSFDDQFITSYQWEILSGPPGSEIKDANMPVAVVMGVQTGCYKFKLTVQDEQGASDSTILTVTVKEAEHLPLTAHASGSHSLTLPNNSLVLRGSVSNNSSANVSFQWVRDGQSPAAGDVLFGSEHQASLFLANLVAGTYLFQLRVTDGVGRSSTATATVEVRPDLHDREMVELELQVPITQISQQQREAVVRQLAALLHVKDLDIIIKSLHGQSDISTVFRFSVQGPDGTIPGPKLARLLKYQLLKEKTDYLLFKVLRVDTVMCLLLCSGRGQCDPVTRSCSCHPLWMENPFRRFLDDESNCDWSVLYVSICCIVVIIFLVSTSWAWCKRPTCFCHICCFGIFRSRRTKVRKKNKYTILDDVDEQERTELRPKYNIKHRSTEHNSSLMMSESELDSEQDTIFSNERTDRARHRANGALINGESYSLRPVDG